MLQALHLELYYLKIVQFEYNKANLYSERKISRKPKEEKVSRHFQEIKKKQHPQLVDAKQ